MGCVAYLRIKGAALQAKPVRTDLVAPKPELLDEEALAVKRAIQDGVVSAIHDNTERTTQIAKLEGFNTCPSQAWVGISMVATPRETLQDEVMACLQELSGEHHPGPPIKLDACHRPTCRERSFDARCSTY